MHGHTQFGGPLPSGTRPLASGDPASIGPYVLLGGLGQGGMGAVYLAADGAGRRVAVKVVRSELAADPAYRARFHDEVRHARRVASFCTAAVLDHGEDAGRPYLVTEYVDGAPLSDHIGEHGALPAGTLHGVAVGVAAALTAIHSAGLVHRDLKPANVLLSISGPRVIDFGIARGVGEGSGHTGSGVVVGSPGWISPEQVRTGEVTPASDVFAWGCLVGFAGIGRHPFDGADPRATSDPLVMAYRAQERLYDLGDLAEPLRTLVARALSPDPRARPAAQDLLLALVGGTPRPREPEAAATPEAYASFEPPLDILTAAGQSIDATWRPEDLPLWTPPGEPLPPPAAPPPVDPAAAGRGRTRAWIRRGVTLTVLGGVGAAGLAIHLERARPAEGEFGRPARDGEFTFEAAPPECDVKVKGVRAQDGKLCRLRLTVTNTGVSARVLDPAEQRLRGSTGSGEGAIALFKGTVPNARSKLPVRSVATGASFTGVLVYDVPPGFSPSAVELHVDGSSKGVRLPLP
ncbi:MULTISPECIES: serine/threonine-protein kinase [Actinomadura]|uniref:Serine/threonine-protein kinase n=1 Tax=Actinomadura yumaensis TaxID=111807 RepID=A0ABW2CVS0_9ACTN|nr:serine/threonine-protein kinase [Actinomadura sp. J1-007]